MSASIGVSPIRAQGQTQTCLLRPTPTEVRAGQSTSPTSCTSLDTQDMNWKWLGTRSVNVKMVHAVAMVSAELGCGFHKPLTPANKRQPLYC